MSPPESATRPLERLSPSTFMVPMLMPWARLMLGLEPVARMALPCSVPKYQYKKAMMAAVNSSPTTMLMGTFRPVSSREN